MRKVFAGLMLAVPVVGLIYGLSVCQAHPAQARHDLKMMANDLPAFLHYEPTDGASRAGQIRRDMRLSQVDPD